MVSKKKQFLSKAKAVIYQKQFLSWPFWLNIHDMPGKPKKDGFLVPIQ